MSNFRQPLVTAPVTPTAASRIAVRSSAVGFTSGYRWRDRLSDWGQLIWASRGAITLTVNARLWIVPWGRALWLPPRTRNDVTLVGEGVLRSVHLTRARSRALPRFAQLIPFAPLLRELLRRTLERETLDAARSFDAHLIALLVHELAAQARVPSPPVDVPLPSDVRAVRAAHCMLEAPGAAIATLALPRIAGASQRTLERLFRAETGVSLGAWHHRATIVHAIGELARGSTVSAAARAAGYRSSSAFIVAFRRLTGNTPSQFAKNR
jgi:AraC-like DNA-binding protein